MLKTSHIVGICLAFTLLVAVSGLALAQAPEGQEYVIQADDWLSKIAEKEYGDPLAYPAIVEATNAKAAEDDSFGVIDNPDVIEVGQKVWLPELSLAEEPSPVGPVSSADQVQQEPA